MSEQAQLPAGVSGGREARSRPWMPTLAQGLSVGEYIRSVMFRLAVLIAVLLSAIWALDGQGYFWPAWAWLGLGVPLMLDRTASWAWRHPPGAVRRVACVWALVSVAAVILMLTWRLGRAEVRVEREPDLRRLIHDAQREAHRAIAELRDLARGIVPPLLADRGLVAAIESLAARYGLGTSIRSDTQHRLAPAVERGAYFVIAEALANTAKHASATRSWVALSEAPSRLVVVVGDDGRGGADPDGSGLAGLRARIEALDGKLTVLSPVGEGTVLEVGIPCVS